MAYHQQSQVGTYPGYQGQVPATGSGRNVANRLDDAITQLRSLKQGQGAQPGSIDNGPQNSYTMTSSHGAAHGGFPQAHGGFPQAHVRFPQAHGGFAQAGASDPPQSMSTYRSITKSSSSGSSGLKSPPPTAKKPSIPPELRRVQGSGPFSPSSTSSNGSNPPSGGPTISAATAVTYDQQGRCTCCPFGYHVDVDFVNFSQETRSSPSPSYSRTPRRSVDSQYSLNGSQPTSASTSQTFFAADSVDKPPSQLSGVRRTNESSRITPQRPGQTTVTEYTTVTPHHPVSQTTIQRAYNASTRSQPNGQPLKRTDSNETLDSSHQYNTSSSQIKTTKRTVTSTLAETMAAHLPDGGTESLTISPESVQQIKKHVTMNTKRMQELEEQLAVIPLMQERISKLKSEKKMLGQQLQAKSGLSNMRSIGVGDYDVDEEETKIEKVIQTVVQEVAAPKALTTSVGVGNYDVMVEYVTEAEAYHTIAERVQRVREKEIQTWIQEAEQRVEQRRAASRSIGVGDGDVNHVEEVKVKETEIKTVYIEPEKPEQRNVGLQVKPSMRDVCIEYSHCEDKPTTRTCGFNVDVSDIMQEMQVQQQQQEQQMSEWGDSGEYQQAGALAGGSGLNAWQTQKHVIQRKFMEAMVKGSQKDLVAFITGLLRRSVRSVGTTVKPQTTDTGTTSFDHGVDCTSVGVGDDSINVIVKPFVMTRDNFCSVRPTTRTQPTWTDLILTCNTSTNTQETYTPSYQEKTTTITQQQSPGASGYGTSMVGDSSSGSTSKSTITKTSRVVPSRGGSVGSDSGYGISMVGDGSSGSNSESTITKTSRVISSSGKSTGSASGYGTSMIGDGSSGSNSDSTVTKSSRVVSSSGGLAGSASGYGTSMIGDGSSGSNSDSTITKTSRVLSSSSGSAGSASGSSGGKQISREYIQNLLGANTQEVAVKQEVKPEQLVEEKTEILEDGSVSEVRREVTSGPGMHSERTVRVTTNEDSSSGVQQESVQTVSKKVTKSSSSSSSSGSIFGADFQKHKEDMMCQLAAERGLNQPISIDTGSAGGSSSSSSRTVKTASVNSGGGSSSSGSSGVRIEREAPAIPHFESEQRSSSSDGMVMKSGISGGIGSSGESSSRSVRTESKSGGDYTEVIEEKESGDGMMREVTMEKSFVSSGSSGPPSRRFTDFSDYFGATKNKPPPSGHSNRMQCYDATSYSSTTSADAERNKTEIAGDPLKARYNIDDLASPSSSISSHSPAHRSSTTTTSTVFKQSATGSSEGDDPIPRSIIKSSTNKSSSKRSGITFAREAQVAVDADEGTASEGETSLGSNESFEEGTLDMLGNVTYSAEIESSEEKGLSEAKSEEEIDIDVELQAACSIVQQSIESNEQNPSARVTSALNVIQQDWFKIATGRNADYNEVEGYLACFEDFSTELLEHIVNMADGNGNTALHYAVSHCNFAVIRLIVDSGVADVNLQNKAGYTPIMLAALAEINNSDERRTIKRLLSKGNVNLAAPQAGQTALMLAVSHGRLDMVQLLLDAGSDVNMQDEDGSTALMCATEHGHEEIVRILLDHPEIDISLQDNDGSSALEIALENGQKELGMLLYAKDQALKANSTASIKKRTSRIPSGRSTGSRSSSSGSRVTTVTTRR